MRELRQMIQKAAPGTILEFKGQIIEGTFIIDKPLTIIGGTFIVPHGSDGIYVRADNVTLDGVSIQGGMNGIRADHASRLVIRNCTILDSVYGGIMLYSCRGCEISGNVIRRIGVGQPIATNAYGIALSAKDSGNLAKDPMTCDVVVSSNRISDIPTWHGIDTHGGVRIAILDNTLERISRPIFITSLGSNRPRAIVIRGNKLLAPGPDASNLVPLTLFAADDVQINNNEIRGWGRHSLPRERPYLDYKGQSTGVIVGQNNQVIR